jgi:hypothetical protein
MIELKFDSLPSGGVYEDGHSAELCRTPCTFNVENGKTDRRTYMVRADGYRDASIVVDLAAAKRDFQVTLERTTPVVEPDPKPVTAIKTGRLIKKVPGKTIKKPDDKPPEDKPEPTAKPEPVKKPDPDNKKIDPTDLADPFKRKR